MLTISLASCLAKLFCALPVDIKQHVTACSESFHHRFFRRAVVVIEDFSPFQQFTFFHAAHRTVDDQ